MTRITITADSPLSLAEFKTKLEQPAVGSSSLDSVFGLMRELVTFEEKYKLASDVFYARFMRGEMGDAMPYIKWAGRYELYLEAKQSLNEHLAALPVAANDPRL